MANGEIGLLLQSAVKVVEEGSKFVQELVTTHHHKTEENLVKDQLHKVKHATSKIALVRMNLRKISRGQQKEWWGQHYERSKGIIQSKLKLETNYIGSFASR